MKEEEKRKQIENQYRNFLTRLEEVLKIRKSSDSFKDREETIGLYIKKLKDIDNQFTELIAKYNELTKECEKLRTKATNKQRKLADEPFSALFRAIIDKLRR